MDALLCKNNMIKKNIWLIIGFISLILTFLFDFEITKAVTKLQGPIINEIVISTTHLMTIFLILFIIPLIYFAIKKDYKMILNLIIGAALCFVITYFIKYLLMRPRPFEMLSISSLTTEFSPAFPSAHAALTFFYAFLFRDKFKYFNIVIIVYASWVAFSRIFLGMHFASDVIAGIILAYLILKLLLAVESKCTKEV
jgi:undecaprenyl-diphosphatase